MADDIVTRLRRITAKPLGLVIDPPPHPLCKEAADEIERLRAEAWALAQDLFFMGAEVNKFAGENYEQYCEIQRLRAERDAIDTLHHPVPSGKDDEVCNHCIGFWPCTTHSLLHPKEARRD